MWNRNNWLISHGWVGTHIYKGSIFPKCIICNSMLVMCRRDIMVKKRRCRVFPHFVDLWISYLLFQYECVVYLCIYVARRFNFKDVVEMEFGLNLAKMNKKLKKREKREKEKNEN